MQNKTGKLRILGLTGGIASGKSTVSAVLRKKRGYIFDCDDISHKMMLKGNNAYNEIISGIGGDYLDENGRIDRKRLGKIVFADKDKLAFLEGIVHKYVMQYIFRKIPSIEASEKYKFIVIDAPLLLESGVSDKCDEVWVIFADREIRAGRIMKRNNLTREEAEHRISVQTDWDLIDRSKYVVIDNNGSVLELHAKIKERLGVFLK